MPRYMLLINDTPANYADLTPQQIEELIGKYMAWTKSLQDKGKHLGGEKLKDEAGKRVTSAGVVDGPFVETKEIVGGYYLIEAADYREASELSQGCPSLEFGGSVDVREIDEVPS